MKKTDIANAVAETMLPTSTQEEKAAKSVEELLAENEPIHWESLDELREELNPAVSSFLDQIMALTTNQEIIDNLGDSKVEFDKYIDLFLSDMDKFSKGIAAIRNEHAGKTGVVKTDKEYAEFTSCSFKYQGAYMNITQIVTPILIQLMGLVATSQRNRPQAKELAEAAAMDVNVITDVVPKTVH